MHLDAGADAVGGIAGDAPVSHADGNHRAGRHGRVGTGPLVTGRIFDLTGSYSVPFSMCAAIFALGAFITTLVYPAPGHDLVPIPACKIPSAAIIPETSGLP